METGQNPGNQITIQYAKTAAHVFEDAARYIILQEQSKYLEGFDLMARA
jgi:hypothetical protein